MLSVSALGYVPAWANLKAEVAGIGGRKCLAYLHAPDGIGNLPIVYLQAGTGLYSTEKDDDLHSAVAYLLKKKMIAAVTIDKPGITPDDSSRNGFAVDDSQYNQHTQGDLVTCAGNAISWARKQPQIQTDGDIYFIGHSEGAQVVTRLYADLLENNSLLARNVKLLVLSGIPMKGWKEIIDHQLKDPVERELFWKSYERKDDSELRKRGELPFTYWTDILGTEPLIRTLERLADKSPEATFQLYQGLFDENTVTEPVIQFETWNKQRRRDGKPAISLSARYYAADHHLNLSALNDMIFALSVQLAP